jgi:hypothetical protein
MPAYSYSLTDLDQYETEAIEIALPSEEIFDFGATLAREVATSMPDLKYKGMCVVLYDHRGSALSIVPIGTLH